MILHCLFWFCWTTTYAYSTTYTCTTTYALPFPHPICCKALTFYSLGLMVTNFFVVQCPPPVHFHPFHPYCSSAMSRLAFMFAFSCYVAVPLHCFFLCMTFLREKKRRKWPEETATPYSLYFPFPCLSTLIVRHIGRSWLTELGCDIYLFVYLSICITIVSLMSSLCIL